MRRHRRWLTATLSLAAVLFVVLGAALAVGYVRLQHGPIPLAFATALIERQIAEEVGGGTVRIGGAELVRGDDGEIEIGLSGLQLLDASGATLAQAPRANVKLSRRALATGRFAIRRVELVAPRVHLFYAEDGSIALRFAGAADVPDSERRAGDRPLAAPGQLPAGPAASADGDGGGQRIDLVKTVADFSRRARERESASAYLREIAFKQATVVVDSGSRKTIWRVPEFQLDLAHRAARSEMAGSATIASLTGPWTVAFNTFEAAQSDKVQFSFSIHGLNPRGLARLVPSLALFEGVDVPLNGEARVELSSAGALRAATLRLAAAPGRIFVPWLGRTPLAVDTGALDLDYDATKRRIDVSRAMLGLAESRIEFAGHLTAEPAPAGAAAATVWTYDIRSTSGAIADDGARGRALAIDQVTLRGQAVPLQGRLTLAELAFRAGGAEITAKGDVADMGGLSAVPGGSGGTVRGTLDGRVGPMRADILKALWPRTLAPDARDWVARHLTKGQFNGGSFRVATAGSSARTDAAGEPDARLSLTLEAAGAEIQLARTLPPIEIPKGLVRVEGQTVEVTAPEASIAAADGRRVQLKTLRFTAVETAAGDQPTAEIALRLQGPLGAVAEILDREPLNLTRIAGLAPTAIDGKVEGQIKLTLPLADNVQASEVRSEGRLRITDLRVKGVHGPYDVSGGAFNIDISDKAVDVKGDVLVRGVNAKVNWQYLVNAPPERQPPVRITANLDTSDRAQLGLDVNDEIIGELPVEITIARDAKGELQTRVRADLTKAELRLDHIAWKKPPGRAATFQFDPVKGPGTGAAQRLELQNVRLVGDDIAVEGFMAVGPDNKLREFFFPDFSVNVVTRLEVQGKLRPDNVWDVKARGATFDGRDVFRSMFSVGQPAERAPPPGRPGLELTAEVDTVIGFSDTTLKAVKLKASKRGEKFIDLDLKASHESGKPFAAEIRVEGASGRRMRAHSNDAGQAFRLVGFYPNAVGGEMKLQVNLDEKGAIEKTGLLFADNFAVLGDPVVSEVFQSADSSSAKPPTGPRKKVVRSQFDFDVMRVPFSIGSGQFVFNDAIIKGPVIGTTMRGKVDFRQQTMNIGGTYVPLSGLNSALGAIPVLGLLLAGPQGEGVLGITFQIVGPTNNPQVNVNPFSLVAPGIFREIFQMTPEQFKVIPRADKAAVPSRKSEAAVRNSSAPPSAAAVPAGQPAPRPRAQATQPEVLSDWASEVKAAPKKAP